jgi:hypothetical protein
LFYYSPQLSSLEQHSQSPAPISFQIPSHDYGSSQFLRYCLQTKQSLSTTPLDIDILSKYIKRFGRPCTSILVAENKMKYIPKHFIVELDISRHSLTATISLHVRLEFHTSTKPRSGLHEVCPQKVLSSLNMPMSILAWVLRGQTI